VAIPILIPLKRLAAAKQRLRPAIGDAERRALMVSMLQRVADAACASGVGPVTLVSSEPRAPELARQLAIGHADDAGLPWNDGLVHALDSLRPVPAAVIYLAADLPLVTADDLRVFAAAIPQRGIAVARAHDGGTNALGLRPPTAIAPRFGVDQSAAEHVTRAQAAGLDQFVVDLPGLAFDVDTPADVARLQLCELPK